jgi:hypothetical protein
MRLRRRKTSRRSDRSANKNKPNVPARVL